MSRRRPGRLATSLLALLGAGALLTACTRGGAGPTPAPSPTATSSPAATESSAPTLPASPKVTPRPSPTGTPEPPALTGDILGWFSDPRPDSDITQRTLGVPPASPFAAYVRESAEVVLYDTRTMTERALGAGGFASFSPDGARLAWATGKQLHQWDEIRILDLRTGQQRSLGVGRALRWVDDRTLLVFEQGNAMATIDATTGVHGPPIPGAGLGFVERPTEAAGYRLDRVAQHEPYPFWRSTYRVTHLASGGAFTFDAYRAVIAPSSRRTGRSSSRPSRSPRRDPSPTRRVRTSASWPRISSRWTPRRCRRRSSRPCARPTRTGRSRQARTSSHGSRTRAPSP